MGKISLLVLKTEVSGETGIRTFRVCAVEEDNQGNEIGRGPIELRSIDAQALQNAHGGDYQRFLLEAVKPDLVRRYVEKKTADSHGDSLVGKKL